MEVYIHATKIWLYVCSYKHMISSLEFVLFSHMSSRHRAVANLEEVLSAGCFPPGPSRPIRTTVG